ncbi:MAG: chemotaxis protein CheA [Euryarchaeota archaeon]|nr:chemotaxis protein CheA [Euryarchaeota archaeon]
MSEAGEHLDLLNKALLELERDPGDMDRVNEIFRSAHTLKGMAATMGYRDISELSHKLENVLDRIRNREMEVSGELVDTLLFCVDHLESMIDGVAKGTEVDAGEAFQKLNAILGTPAEPPREDAGEDVPPTPEREPEEEAPPESAEVPLEPEDLEIAEKKAAEGLTPYRIDVTLSPETAMKSIRAFMIIKNLEALGEVYKTVPDGEAIEEEDFDLDFTVFLATREAEEKLAEAVAGIGRVSDVAGVRYRPLARVEREAEKPEEKKPRPPPKRRDQVKSIQTVRVAIDRLDNLMNLVGELVITKGRLKQIGAELQDEVLSETVDSIDRLTTELQDGVMMMRMVEVGQIFDRFPRMVRDLAREEGKEVRLEIEGREIELDRTVLDEIGDPLVHLLRNAVDHGLETPQERAGSGKPREGTIRLTARREKNHVEVVVEDDGRGMDPGSIKEAAVRRGIITEEEAAKLDHDETMRLIFKPGFSTQKTVTGVSGRGVGMDVVNNKITALGGTVEVASRPGRGTRFTLKLPLTLAIIQALLVEVGRETYAIPLNSVVETLALAPEEIQTVKGQETYVLRGTVLPLVRLREVLKVPDGGESRTLMVVVVEWSGKQIGLVVDGLLGQDEIVIKTLGDFLTGLRGFAGATIMGDGRVVLILDIATLI